ncbi:hypothetical protein KUTeg_005916 [Tegillarca granosa]|uniref:Impact N-terminal domain-containing protein n=1 Tax=Tegillarca granosa TaxID=220873 RepID=A0ABQ9FGT1_TEGGR|nr:hypothetical protein KUTeg_005916 [Tegillarca granosa]
MDRVHRIGPRTVDKTTPRAVLSKLHDYTDKVLILSRKDKLPQGICISSQFPDKKRQNRKRLCEVQKQFNLKGIRSKVKGDKLVLSNGQAYKEPISCSKASTGNTLPENGNIISARATSVLLVNEAREALIQMMKLPSVARSMHKITDFLLVDDKGVLQEGVDDDGEYGAGSAVLSFFRNVLMVVSRVFGAKMGPKRFKYFTEAAQSALHRVGQVSTSTAVSTRARIFYME